jgi:hypothetical protein
MFEHDKLAGEIRGEFLNRFAPLESNIRDVLLLTSKIREFQAPKVGAEIQRQVRALRENLVAIDPDLVDPKVFDRIGRANRLRKTLAHGRPCNDEALAGVIPAGEVWFKTRSGQIEHVKAQDVEARSIEIGAALWGLAQLCDRLSRGHEQHARCLHDTSRPR